jgi:polyphosphate kinase
VYISSADMMPRNLDRRVEILCPLQNPTVHRSGFSSRSVANLRIMAELAVVARWIVNAYEAAKRRRALQPPQLFHDNPGLSGRGVSKEGSPRRLTRRNERQQSS